jgi:hypothetical protein
MNASRTLGLVFSSLVLAVTACGTSVIGDGGAAGTGAAGTGAQGTGGDGGGCIDPTAGQPCTPDQTACGHGDHCCVGGWTCDQSTMTWQKVVYGCACAPPVACGTTMCAPGLYYCEELGPGVAAADGGTPSPSYSCVATPPSCPSGPTCACIEAYLMASSECTCTQDAFGLVTVHCPEA